MHSDLQWHAGEQEKPAANLQKIHADTIRKEVEALKDIPSANKENGQQGEPSVGDIQIVEEEPILGPVLLEDGEAEDDPYNLPITHEVALEGAPCL